MCEGDIVRGGALTWDGGGQHETGGELHGKGLAGGGVGGRLLPTLPRGGGRGCVRRRGWGGGV